MKRVENSMGVQDYIFLLIQNLKESEFTEVLWLRFENKRYNKRRDSYLTKAYCIAPNFLKLILKKIRLMIYSNLK